MAGYRTALGLVIGFAVGLVLGLLWFDQNWWWPPFGGGGLGLVVGAVADLRASPKVSRER